MISDETAQVNLKITKQGSKDILEVLGSEKQKTDDKKISFREKAVKESLENIGKISAEDAKNIKGKIKGH